MYNFNKMNFIYTFLLEGWFRAGDQPQNYLMGVDFTTFYDKPIRAMEFLVQNNIELLI